MQHVGKLVTLLCVIVGCASGARPSTIAVTTAKGNGDIIVVETPASGGVVRSPLVVRGRARGPWFFEASFPVTLVDASGKQLAQVPAQAQGEWMTEQYVPFEAVLTFDAQGASEGTLILQKDNASGLPEHDDEVRLPVRFVPFPGASP